MTKLFVDPVTETVVEVTPDAFIVAVPDEVGYDEVEEIAGNWDWQAVQREAELRGWTVTAP